MNDLLVSIISSIGGTTVVLGGLFGWLGKRHLDKVLETERSVNKTNLALLQSKLKLNEKFLDNQLEASFKLYKMMKDIVPEKTDPDMGWYEACDGIAHNFEEIAKLLSKFLENHYTTLPPEIYEMLQDTEYLCSNGKLGINGPEIDSEMNATANTVFQNIKDSCIKLKSHIDGQREIQNLSSTLKNKVPNNKAIDTHD